MSESQQSLVPLSRVAVTSLYVFEGLLFIYSVYGALQGKLALPSKTGPIVLHGWAAWLACVFPLAFAALIYVRFDPSVKLPVPTRKRLMFVSLGVGFIALLAAVLFGPKT